MKVPFMNVMNLRYSLAWIVIKMHAHTSKLVFGSEGL